MGQLTPDDEVGPIGRVVEGMHVVDAAGERLGQVEAVKMGDPNAVTGQGQTPRTGHSFLGDLVSVFDDPALPPQLAARLLRIGFVKVDGKGLFDRDFYVAADQIAGVRDDTVQLTVTRARLTEEA